MTRDFEERLRESLQARAEDVTPDPAMFAAVQSRIRRRQLARWSLAGVGALGLVAVATVVFPTLTDRRVEFEPGPVATQPGSEAPTPTATPIAAGAMPVAEGLFFTDGLSTYAIAPDGESATLLWEGDPAGHCPNGGCAADPLITDVAVDPGGSWSGLTVLERLSQNCGELTWGTADLSGDEPVLGGGGITPQQQCPGGAVFSPDGRHIAWISAGSEPGAWALGTVDWTGSGIGEDDVTFGLDLPSDAVVQIQDWYWTQQSDDTAAGSIALSVTLNDERQVYLLAVERQGDGALAVSGDPEPTSLHEGYGAAAFADSQSGDGRITYALLVSRENQQWSVVRSETRTPGMGPDHSAQRDLPDAMVPPVPSDVSDIWISALGNTVVFGDGQGQAWLIEFDETGGGPPRKLPATVVHADLFGGGAPAPPPRQPEATTTTVEIFFGREERSACSSVAAVPRDVAPPRVARGALNELLAGPTPQENAAGFVSPFLTLTADGLNNIRIENGTAHVDFRDFRSELVTDDPCARDAIVAALDATLLQFATIERAVYSFDGSVAEFDAWTGRAAAPPEAVLQTAKRIREAAQARDYDSLRTVIVQDKLSCSFSDQNDEDCVALWQQQERDGQDPLGVMAKLLKGPPAKNPDAPIWVWPARYIDFDRYRGPRLGIDEDGAWRFFVQGGD